VTETADFCDMRVLTPQELNLIIVEQRQQRGWTQATLAELSRLTERTISGSKAVSPAVWTRAARWQAVHVMRIAIGPSALQGVGRQCSYPGFIGLS
jgi:hypothetical protein